MDTNISNLLKQELPQISTLNDPDSLAFYGRDWVKHYTPRPSTIAFPTSTEEVAKLVKWARKNKICLVPSGGRTGLSGGAIALNGEVVVSLEKMNRVLDFNTIDRTVRTQCGIVTEALQKHVWDQGYYFPVDFASRGSSQIGGNIATNAGGVKVIRYGSMRDWVSSLQVVTGTGEILEFNNGLIKNATGLDFRHLFIGSEGVLGFVTEATLKFTVQPKPLTVMLLGVQNLDAIMKVFRLFRDSLPLTAFEFFSELALKHVLHHTGFARPMGTTCPYYLLIEVEALNEEMNNLILSNFEKCVEEEWALDGVIAQNETQAREFWRMREDISEATSPYVPYKNDISVTIANVPAFLADVDSVLNQNYPDFEVVWFGHIGDGNMHINILKPDSLSKEAFLEKCLKVNTLLFDVVKKYQGSISAEHGVGLVKKPYLTYSRSEQEISLMKEIKKIFDPDLILNPGKIWD